MVVDQIHYCITMEETSQSASSTPLTSPLFGLIDLFLFGTLFNRIHFFLANFWFFLLSQISYSNSNAREDKKTSDCELSDTERLDSCHGSRDDGKVERDEVKMVMAKLRFFCSPESEELEESYGSSEICGVFEEEEPSLEEVKEAFDVFDENRDGFIEAVELQRVLTILGMKEATDLENCQKMISHFDGNRDGRIDFNEFVKIMEKSFH